MDGHFSFEEAWPDHELDEARLNGIGHHIVPGFLTDNSQLGSYITFESGPVDSVNSTECQYVSDTISSLPRYPTPPPIHSLETRTPFIAGADHCSEKAPSLTSSKSSESDFQTVLSKNGAESKAEPAFGFFLTGGHGMERTPDRAKTKSIKCDKCDATLTRKADLKRHMFDVHSTEKLRCGYCQEFQTSENRKDRMRAHFNKPHKITCQTYQILVCKAGGCYARGTVAGVCFGTQDEYTKHMRSSHGLPEFQTTPIGDAYSLSSNYNLGSGLEQIPEVHKAPTNTNAKNLPPVQDVANHDNDDQDVSMQDSEWAFVDVTSSAKRVTPEPEPTSVKRNKVTGGDGIHSNTEESKLRAKVKQTLLELDEKSCRIEESNSLIIIKNVKPTEVLELTEKTALLDIEDELKEYESGPDKSFSNERTGHINWNVDDQSVQLCGPAYLVSRALSVIEKQVEPSHHKEFERKTMNTRPHEQTNCRRRKNDTEFNLYPINGAEAEAEFWNSQMISKIPGIMKGAGFDCYQAALVREGSSETNSKPTIRISSPTECLPNKRSRLKKIIHDIFHKSGIAAPHIAFAQEELSLLGGGRKDENETPEDEMGPKEADLSFIPHHRRFWHLAGMGASIGVKGCNSVSGTLGGYLNINDTKYILTTKHFIKEAEKGLSSAANEQVIESPSWDDRYTVLRKLHDLGADLNIGVRDKCKDRGIGSLSLGKIHSESTAHGGTFKLDKDLSILISQWKTEHDQSEDKFSLGRVDWLCPVDNVTCDTEQGPGTGSRRMDWALCAVTNRSRKGKNKHRHQKPTQMLKILDAREEKTKADGVGEEVQRTCTGYPIKEEVHYFGAGTGFQTAKVNGTRAIHKDKNGQESQEFTLIVDKNPRVENVSSHEGDSGAWVINGRNELVGMIWGEWDGQIIFTPIGDIIKDIKRTMQCNDASVWQEFRRLDNVQRICRKTQQEKEDDPEAKYDIEDIKGRNARQAKPDLGHRKELRQVRKVRKMQKPQDPAIEMEMYLKPNPEELDIPEKKKSPLHTMNTIASSLPGLEFQGSDSGESRDGPSTDIDAETDVLGANDTVVVIQGSPLSPGSPRRSYELSGLIDVNIGHAKAVPGLRGEIAAL